MNVPNRNDVVCVRISIKKSSLNCCGRHHPATIGENACLASKLNRSHFCLAYLERQRELSHQLPDTIDELQEDRCALAVLKVLVARTEAFA